MTWARVLWHRLAMGHGWVRHGKIWLGTGEFEFEQWECLCGAWVRLHRDGSWEIL